MTSTAAELYQEGRLDEAVKSASEDVKRHPKDAARRGFLAELLCLNGDLERADKQLVALSSQDPSTAVGVALFRQVVRAELARQEFYRMGRPPEFLTPPSPELQLHLRASIALREGAMEEAGKLLEVAEAARVHPHGLCDGASFDDLRDLDDTTASFIEVLTSTGKYYWVPMQSIDSLEFHPPQRPRDLLWRRAHMVVQGGPDGEIFVPAIYADPLGEGDERARLGRFTDWRGGDGEPARGLGQRTFLVGEETRSIMEITNLGFERD